MQNLTKLKKAALIADAQLHLGSIEGAKAAMADVLHQITALDAVWQAMALAGVLGGPARPASYVEPKEPLKYRTGRVAERLGIEPNNSNLRRLYAAEQKHQEVVDCLRLYNHELASGEMLKGKPPLTALTDDGICAIDQRALLERYSAPAEQARLHAHKAALTAAMKAARKKAKRA